MQHNQTKPSQIDNKEAQTEEIIAKLLNQELLLVNPRRKNGLILYKRYYAEFAGPGAVVGSVFDPDVKQVVPVGNLSLIHPQTRQEKINAYLIRRQWVRLINQITDNPISLQRAQVILNQFENWFDMETTAKLPDEAFAMLVGVLPQTIHKARSNLNRFDWEDL
jgi:hypothetical protein